MRITDFKAVLFDMDGTLYHDEHALPGAKDLIAHLAGQNIPYACLTNAGWRTPDQLIERLSKMGVTLKQEQLYTAGQAVADWILSRWDSPRVCNFAGSALQTMLEGKATFVTEPDDACDVVAVAGHMHAEGGEMNMPLALCALAQLRKGAAMVVTCRDRVYPVPNGFAFGSGSVAAMFAYAANLAEEDVHFVGKPGAAFFEQLCQRLNVSPQDCLLVGDNLESDIKGGNALGMTTALVFTGVTSREQLAASDIQPTHVYANLLELMKTLT